MTSGIVEVSFKRFCEKSSTCLFFVFARILL